MFAGECKQLAFVKPFADRLRRPRHDREMGKADLARLHGVGAPRQVGQALTHRKPVVGRVGGHPAVEADPIPRSVKAFVVPPVGLVELSGELSELELELVDDPAQADQLTGDCLARRDHLEHASIVSNIGTRSKLLYTHSSSDLPYLRVARPSPSTLFTAFPAVNQAVRRSRFADPGCASCCRRRSR